VPSAPLHRAVDLLALWLEDRVDRPPQPYRPAPEGPLRCLGPLPTPPEPPPGEGWWRFPAPWAGSGGPRGDRVAVSRTAAIGERRGTVLLVPPWKLRSTGLLRGWVRLLAGRGWEVWLLVPPHHLERTLPGARNGEGFVGNDLGRTREAVEETVIELRLLAAAAARRGPVGLVGLSLGALPAALAATAPEPLAFAALVAPPADLAQLYAGALLGGRYARLAEEAGAPLPGPAELRRQLEPLSPHRRSPTAGRVLVAAGLHDAVVPPAVPVALARAWGLEPRLFPRGHLGLLFACRALRREVAALCP